MGLADRPTAALNENANPRLRPSELDLSVIDSIAPQ